MDQRPDLKSVTIPWGGCTYSGAVSNGVPDDLGKWSHPDGHEYIGEFREGKIHGQGTYTGPDGSKVVSRFIEGLPVTYFQKAGSRRTAEDWNGPSFSTLKNRKDSALPE